MTTKIIHNILIYIGLVFILSLGANASGSLLKVKEEYGDLGLYETFELHGSGEKCMVVVLHDDTIIHTTCKTSRNSKGKKIYCTKRKKLCKMESELLTHETVDKKVKQKKNRKKPSSGYTKDLAAFQKSCRKGEKIDCYVVKRYKIFNSACDKGDKHSCKVLSYLREAQHGMARGDILSAQSFSWSINNEVTSAGK